MKLMCLSLSQKYYPGKEPKRMLAAYAEHHLNMFLCFKMSHAAFSAVISDSV